MTTISEKNFTLMSSRGHISKQDMDQHELVLAIMKAGWEREGKVWWFAYELMGHKMIKGANYFMSYKASTRVSELALEGSVESRKSEGKLHLYASKEVLQLAI